MKIKRLKEIVNSLDDEMQVFISPLEEIRVTTKNFLDPIIFLSPSLLERYKVIVSMQAGAAGENGLYESFLLLGYDKTDHGQSVEIANPDFVN